MEIRDFTGRFVIDGIETEPMDLRVLITTGGGEVHGSGSFRLPAALVGAERGGPLTFLTTGGEELRMTIREFDMVHGMAYFLVEGEVSALRKRA